MQEHSETSGDRYSAQGSEIATDATSYVDRFVNYAKANPVETALATAGVAFVAGAIILGPRLLRSRDTDLHKMLAQASRQAKRVKSDLPSVQQLSSWVKARLPA